MLTIRNWHDLEQYGVIHLTGEACGYGYRQLCDLTPAGIELVKQIFDAEDIKLRENWNHGQGQTASIMLPYEMFTPLAVFALFNAGCSKVYVLYQGGICGVEPSDEQANLETWLSFNQGKFCEACQRYGAGGVVQFQYSNPGYARNRHQMSGRTS